jgi:RimJ/RimL family protein N-acetyltransferase
LREHPDTAQWSMWYIVLVGTNGGPDVAVGLAGFKGPPDELGVVEVGYGVLEAFRRRGIATEATARLIDFAMTDRAVTRVAAETYPELVASIGVMLRNRMRYMGPGSEPGVIRYEVSREVWTSK